jgi:putative FmdB family regulatory protein
MPTYDYECKNCGHRFEVFQGITDKLLRKCPACGKMKLARLIGGGAGIIFRGSGFYATDYRSNSRSPARAGSSASSGSESTADSGSSSGSKGSDD